MARAILDMPLPQNCYECPMRRMYRRKWFCQIIMHVACLDQRRPDCPLVEMDVKALVEALWKARKALHKGISELKVHCKYFDQTPEEDACIEMHEAVVEIDKALEGMEDV